MRAFWVVVSIILTEKPIDPHSETIRRSKKASLITEIESEDSIKSVLCPSRAMKESQIVPQQSADKRHQSHQIISQRQFRERSRGDATKNHRRERANNGNKTKLDSLLSRSSNRSSFLRKKSKRRRNCRQFSHHFSRLVHSDLFLAPLEAATKSFQV